jgi:hypothetical protein
VLAFLPGVPRCAAIEHGPDVLQRDSARGRHGGVRLPL